MLLKNSCFVSGHDFRDCGKKLPFAISVVWLEGAFLVTKEGAPYLARFWPDVGKATVGARVPIVPENFRFKAIYLRVGVFFVMPRFSRPSKNSCFVSGHDFSRAVKGKKSDGL